MSRTIELNSVNGFPARGGKVDWGLAISGGGIRSGSYSIGVLKALYDVGFLNEVDAISTVSGGGFATYWLYGRHLERQDESFGNGALSDGSFLTSVNGLKSRSNMYSYWKMFSSIFRSRKSASTKWGSAIHKTFGQNSQALGSTRLGFFSPVSNASKLPMLIVNTTLVNVPKKPSKPKFESEALIEITPNHVGGVSTGFATWSNADSGPRFIDVVATSAAGKKHIRRTYPNFSAADIDTFGKFKSLDLYDGGCSENLGAMSLIRRGIENVVIIDAEHDPKYLYASYVKLRESLDRDDIELKVDEIDRVAIPVGELPAACPEDWFSKAKGPNKPPERSVMIGIARNRKTGTSTNVYYIKMSRSSELFPNELESRNWKGKNTRERDLILADHFCKPTDSCSDYCLGRDMALGEEARNSACDAGASDANKKFEGMFSYLTLRYGYYINAQRRLKFLKGIGDFWAYDFPQTSTSDQSLYPDQMEAFIGLGYLQGKRLAARIGPSLSSNRPTN
ncbi:MAG TPA: patatin-like phospholipase family protein [Pyrinomonadaceae bacterium]|nr:patatin-like phospholipase family protein [Pyrinomonadaceae bacterium]